MQCPGLPRNPQSLLANVNINVWLFFLYREFTRARHDTLLDLQVESDRRALDGNAAFLLVFQRVERFTRGLISDAVPGQQTRLVQESIGKCCLAVVNMTYHGQVSNALGSGRRPLLLLLVLVVEICRGHTWMRAGRRYFVVAVVAFPLSCFQSLLRRLFVVFVRPESHGTIIK